MKVVVTGASGLLGRAVYQAAKDKDWDVVGLAFTRAGHELHKVDLTKFEEVEKLLMYENPNFIVHTAAQRFPNKVENDFERSKLLNVAASGHLATIASKIGSRVLYISTDYVFDGSQAPYKADDIALPINLYGMTKFEGEKEVLKVDPSNLVLRVPVLYGPVKSLEESAVTCLLPALLATHKTSKVSHYERRCPAHVDDIATIVCKLIDKISENGSITGIYQWSGLEVLTKYEMVLAMAEVFDLPHDHLVAETQPPPDSIRPHNVQMDNSKLLALGISAHTPFKHGIKQCLTDWLPDKSKKK